jgi:hypothetical protein
VQSSLANPKARDLWLPGIEATGIYLYCAIGFTGFIATEVARRIGCGHSLHPDLQNSHGDADLEKTEARVESSAVTSIPIRCESNECHEGHYRLCGVMQQSSVAKGLFKYNTVYYSVLGSRNSIKRLFKRL